MRLTHKGEIIMSQYSDFYKQFTDLSHEQRMNLCKNSVGELMAFFKKRGLLEHEDFALSFFTSLIGYFIGADGKVTSNEAAIFNEIFGTDYNVNDLARLLPKLLTTENYIALDDFIDGMSDEEKKYACYIVLAVISADGIVTDKEALLFERILG